MVEGRAYGDALLFLVCRRVLEVRTTPPLMMVVLALLRALEHLWQKRGSGEGGEEQRTSGRQSKVALQAIVLLLQHRGRHELLPLPARP